MYSPGIYIVALVTDNQHRCCKKTPTLDPLEACIRRDSHLGTEPMYSVERPVKPCKLSCQCDQVITDAPNSGKNVPLVR